MLEATMIDPFFFDRLMHAFTTANSTPLSKAAAQAADDQCVANAAGSTPSCRAVQDAEAVVADIYLGERTLPAEPAQPDNRARG
jgi:hypothetical protein